MNNIKTVEEKQPDRNSLALDRTVLANERTYQSWLRTGLASLVSGLGVAKFLKDIMPLGILLIVASILILFSAVAFLLSSWRYSHLHLRIVHLDIDATPMWLVKTVSLILACCSLIAFIGLLVALL